MNDDSYLVPDFSGDDFANDPEIAKAREASKAYKKMVEDSLAIVINELEVMEGSHKNLKGFFMFKNLEPVVRKTFRSSDTTVNLIVSLVEYDSAFPTAKDYNYGSDEYLFGWLQLKKSYPKTLIVKETVQAKIIDLFLSRETDFPEHKRFSRRFHVLTQDPKKLRDLFVTKNLDDFIQFPNMEIELDGHTCLFRNSRKSISPNEASDFCELAKTIYEIFN